MQGNAKELSSRGVEPVFTEKVAVAQRLKMSRGSETSQAMRMVCEKIPRRSSLQEKKFCGAEKVGDGIKEKGEARFYREGSGISSEAI